MIMSTKEICKRGLSMTISLTLGNSGLPFADRGGGYTDLFGEGFLRQAPGAPCAQDNAPDWQLHGNHPLYNIGMQKIFCAFIIPCGQRPHNGGKV